MSEMKLGSLFDGSGGFPLAGAMNGIKPVWASEIEPFPIRVEDHDYYGPKLVAEWDVMRLPTDEEFLKAFKENE